MTVADQQICLLHGRSTHKKSISFVSNFEIVDLCTVRHCQFSLFLHTYVKNTCICTVDFRLGFIYIIKK
jgi:hypothetical protein